MSTTILRALWDKRLFAPWFKDPAGWAAWFAFLKALFALPMTEADLETYHQCTGRTEPPTKTATEAWLICGRRAGKSSRWLCLPPSSLASTTIAGTSRLVKPPPS